MGGRQRLIASIQNEDGAQGRAKTILLDQLFRAFPD
jgi:hypothetical protein